MNALFFYCFRTLFPKKRAILNILCTSERLDSSLRSPQYEGVNVLGSLVGIHNFQVLCVPHNRVLVRNTVASQHVSSFPGRIERLKAGIPLQK